MQIRYRTFIVALAWMCFGQMAHCRDAAVGDGHVGPEPRLARAVDHRAAADD